MALLEVKNLSISFGGLKAVDNFHINIEKGQLYGLIGPNGAGKTTIFNLLTGVYLQTATFIIFYPWKRENMWRSWESPVPEKQRF